MVQLKNQRWGHCSGQLLKGYADACRDPSLLQRTCNLWSMQTWKFISDFSDVLFYWFKLIHVRAHLKYAIMWRRATVLCSWRYLLSSDSVESSRSIVLKTALNNPGTWSSVNFLMAVTPYKGNYFYNDYQVPSEIFQLILQLKARK